MEDSFIRKMEEHLDSQASAFFMLMCAYMWFSHRMDNLVTLAVAGTMAAGILTPSRCLFLTCILLVLEWMMIVHDTNAVLKVII